MTGAPFGTGSRPSDRAADGVSPVPASIPSAQRRKRRLNRTAFEADMSAEIVACVRETARRVMGGNCAYADDDIRFLGRLAELAIDAGLHEQLLVGAGNYTRYNFASAIEARRAETQGGSVADESAVAKPDAQNPPISRQP